MATYYGQDTSCTTGLGKFDLQIVGPKVVSQRLVRRWTTPRGALALIGDDPDFGWDVRQYINRKMTSLDLSTAQIQLQNEALKDEEVQSCLVVLSFVGNALTISATVTLSNGPTFTLTTPVASLSVADIFVF